MNTHLKHDIGRLFLNCHNCATLPMITSEPTKTAASKDKEIIDEEVASSTKETNAKIESRVQQEPIPLLV